jgi:hypothetical protein
MNGISSECLNIEVKQTELVQNCEKIGVKQTRERREGGKIEKRRGDIGREKRER